MVILLPAALASVSFGFVLVRVRVRELRDILRVLSDCTQPSQTCSGGFIKTKLYAICCCFFAIGESNLI